MTMRKPKRKPYMAPDPQGPVHARQHKLMRRWVTPGGQKGEIRSASVAPYMPDRYSRFKGHGRRNPVY